jgi:NADH-quinone oxidoreductase subunit K
MNTIPLSWYLVLSAMLFVTGAAGVMSRRNAIIIFMGIELMLNAVNITLVAFSAFNGNAAGQIFVFFVMTVAAAETAIGLAIVIALYRSRQTFNIDDVNLLKW